MSHRVGREGHPNPVQGSPRQRGAKAESALPFAATTEPAPDAVPHLQGGGPYPLEPTDRRTAGEVTATALYRCTSITVPPMRGTQSP